MICLFETLVFTGEMSMELEEKKEVDSSNVDEIKGEGVGGEITQQHSSEVEQVKKDKIKEDESKYLSLSQVELIFADLHSFQLL